MSMVRSGVKDSNFGKAGLAALRAGASGQRRSRRRWQRELRELKADIGVAAPAKTPAAFPRIFGAGLVAVLSRRLRKPATESVIDFRQLLRAG